MSGCLSAYEDTKLANSSAVHLHSAVLSNSMSIHSSRIGCVCAGCDKSPHIGRFHMLRLCIMHVLQPTNLVQSFAGPSMAKAAQATGAASPSLITISRDGALFAWILDKPEPPQWTNAAPAVQPAPRRSITRIQLDKRKRAAKSGSDSRKRARPDMAPAVQQDGPLEGQQPAPASAAAMADEPPAEGSARPRKKLTPEQKRLVQLRRRRAAAKKIRRQQRALVPQQSSLYAGADPLPMVHAQLQGGEAASFPSDALPSILCRLQSVSLPAPAHQSIWGACCVCMLWPRRAGRDAPAEEGELCLTEHC